MNIFTITLIYSPLEGATSTDDVHRCIGFYTTFEDAINAVNSNKGEMHECRYDHVVIEEKPEGVWRQTINEFWFEWDGDKWVECKKPSKYRQIANVTCFGIG